MKKIETNLPEVFLIELKKYHDERGLFFESWNKKNMESQNLTVSFSQDNVSISKKNVIRGLHFQNKPYAQNKFIQVLKGKIIDVVVDIRKKSPTFGEYVKVELSEYNKLALWIPQGFAHGFLVLEEQTIVSYKCSGEYNPLKQNTLQWDDSQLKINWGITNPIISEKDKQGISLQEYLNNENLDG